MFADPKPQRLFSFGICTGARACAGHVTRSMLASGCLLCWPLGAFYARCSLQAADAVALSVCITHSVVAHYRRFSHHEGVGGVI